MRDELKQEFTRRITTANKSELVVILFDMFDQYMNDACGAIDSKHFDDMKAEIRRGRSVLSNLINALDMQYEISNNLYALYRYAERQLITADIRREKCLIEEARKIMSSLGGSFRTIASADTDGPIMQNTETVYAGMTYGRNELNENLSSGSRGFFA